MFQLRIFLVKFSLPIKIAKMRNEIISFTQHDKESLSKAFKRYKELLLRIPHHGLLDWLQLQTFYNRSSNTTRIVIDATTSGSLMEKNIEDACELPEEITTNAH